MPLITLDLEEWLVSDPQVASSWRSMAKHLSLSIYIPSLEVTRRNRKTDSKRMKELLIIWRNVRPDTYNVDFLLNMLDIMVRDVVHPEQTGHLLAGYEGDVRVDPADDQDQTLLHLPTILCHHQAEHVPPLQAD